MFQNLVDNRNQDFWTIWYILNSACFLQSCFNLNLSTSAKIKEYLLGDEYEKSFDVTVKFLLLDLYQAIICFAFHTLALIETSVESKNKILWEIFSIFVAISEYLNFFTQIKSLCFLIEKFRNLWLFFCFFY